MEHCSVDKNINAIKTKAINLLKMGYEEEQSSYKHIKMGEYEIARIEAESSQYHIGLAYGLKMCLSALGYDVTGLQKYFSNLKKNKKNMDR